MPVDNPVRAWLEEAASSVRQQGYPDWELCVADDDSREPWVCDYFSAPTATSESPAPPIFPEL